MVSVMHTHVTPIDISNNPELMRLAEEVARTKKPRELVRDSKPVAMLMPMTAAKKAKSQKDYTNFLATAGSLKGFIDAEKLKMDFYESGKLSTRHSFQL
jgi:hypothetical protein